MLSLSLRLNLFFVTGYKKVEVQTKLLIIVINRMGSAVTGQECKSISSEKYVCYC